MVEHIRILPQNALYKIDDISNIYLLRLIFRYHNLVSASLKVCWVVAFSYIIIVKFMPVNNSGYRIYSSLFDHCRNTGDYIILGGSLQVVIM